MFTHRFVEYREVAGYIPRRTRGAMCATAGGAVTQYALLNLFDRGEFFVEPGDEIYDGQVIGEHCKEGDIAVNASKMKELTNVRSSNKEATVRIKAKRDMSLEDAMEWIEPDELVEVTPKNFRIRKRELNETVRKRTRKATATVPK